MPKGSNKYAPGARSAVERGIPQPVVDALIDVLGVSEDEITDGATLVEDLGADSLDLVELTMQLEVAYKLPSKAIDDADVEKLSTGTVKGLLAILKKRGALEAS